jgi:hypothetical protein
LLICFQLFHMHQTQKPVVSSARATDDSFVCKVASTTEEATELIELGFEYVNEINGRHLYRKKK